MYKDNFISAIITAAGTGSRMESDIPKLELKISNKTIIEITVSRLLETNVFDEIILVTSEELFELYEERFNNIPNLKVVLGGSSREESTYNGIKALNENSNIVVCHDGARPNIEPELVIKTIDAAMENGAAIVGVRVKDTIKVVNNMVVKSTPDRDTLYQIQTPQVFKVPHLKAAYSRGYNKIAATDDSSYIENLGIEVHMVEGSYDNFKITTWEDYVIMKALLEEI